MDPTTIGEYQAVQPFDAPPGRLPHPLRDETAKIVGAGNGSELHHQPLQLEGALVDLSDGVSLPRVRIPTGEFLMGNNPSEFKGRRDSDQRPVEWVSWCVAMAFCRRLSECSGRRCTLPSKAHWEYACRAGTTTPFHLLILNLLIPQPWLLVC